MNLMIKNREIKYEMKLERISQWTGYNHKIKKFCIDSLEKNYSSYKYHEYENYMTDNIYIDGKNTGRKYFSVIKIVSRDDLIKNIQITKTSLMGNILKESLNEFENQKDIELIDEILSNLFTRINESILKEFDEIVIDYETENIFNMVQNSIMKAKDGKCLEELSDYQLMKVFIEEINKKQKFNPEKLLIIFENIDHIINKDEYRQIMEKLEKLINNSDTYTIISNSMSEYTITDENCLEGITSFNDEIFSLPSYEHIYNYIIQNYPIEKVISREKILEYLNHIVVDIGKNEIFQPEEHIILKLINKSLMVDFKYTRTANSIEMAFLKD